jgi:hypothetical protein
MSLTKLDSPLSHQSPHSKVKLRTSCDQCRKRHRKCDGKLPCVRCANLGLHCIYSQRKKRGIQKKDHPQLDSLHVQMMKMLEEENKRALMWEKLYFQTLERFHQLQQIMKQSSSQEPEKKLRKIEPNTVHRNVKSEITEEWLNETIDLELKLEEISGEGIIFNS